MDALGVLLSLFRAGGKVLVCGNGGSAAIEEEMF
jgi:phosphoheptose isomerase